MLPPSVPRPRCDACALPLRTCLCGLVVPVANDVRVLVLQHPDEVDQAKGSARLLALSLARCELVVGERFDVAALASRLVAGSVLLYPEAALMGAGPPAPQGPGAGVAQLVVIDGTWRKSLRMLQQNPLLHGLPRWSLPAALPARYAALRKARRAGQLSTLEATCAALAGIEGEAARYAPVLSAFDAFVADRAARAPRR